jgi:hypothetical protein
MMTIVLGGSILAQETKETTAGHFTKRPQLHSM